MRNTPPTSCVRAPSLSSPRGTPPSFSPTNTHTHSLFKAHPLYNSSMKETWLYLISGPSSKHRQTVDRCTSSKAFQCLLHEPDQPIRCSSTECSEERAPPQNIYSQETTRFTWDDQVTMGHSAPWQAEKCQERFSSPPPIWRHLASHSEGSRSVPLLKSIPGPQSEQPVFTPSMQLVRVPATSVPPQLSNASSVHHPPASPPWTVLSECTRSTTG